MTEFLTILFAILLLYLGFRYLLARCPRCGNRMNAKRDFEDDFYLECPNCKNVIY